MNGGGRAAPLVLVLALAFVLVPCACTTSQTPLAPGAASATPSSCFVGRFFGRVHSTDRRWVPEICAAIVVALRSRGCRITPRRNQAEVSVVPEIVYSAYKTALALRLHDGGGRALVQSSFGARVDTMAGGTKAAVDQLLACFGKRRHGAGRRLQRCRVQYY